MQQIITAKLKLLTTAEQFQALRHTQLAYRNALNVTSQYAFAHGKTSSATALHRGMYAFAELHMLIAYKAALTGSIAASVDADYTSQACPCCGYTSEQDRPGKGLSFVCQQCGYSLHADLLGARNVTMRTLLLRQDWGKTGYLSITPDGSDKEAKAARLARYAELRWSSVPSLRLEPEVID